MRAIHLKLIGVLICASTTVACKKNADAVTQPVAEGTPPPAVPRGEEPAKESDSKRPAPWVSVKKPQLHLEASFPAEPTPGHEERENALGKVIADFLSATADEHEFTVVITELPAMMALIDSKKLLLDMASATVAKYIGAPPKFEPGELGGIPGLTVAAQGTFEGRKSDVLCRAAFFAGRVFVAGAVALGKPLDRERAQRFLASVKFTGPNAAGHGSLWKPAQGPDFTVEFPGEATSEPSEVEKDGVKIATLSVNAKLKVADFMLVRTQVLTPSPATPIQLVEAAAKNVETGWKMRDLKTTDVTIPGAVGRDYAATCAIGSGDKACRMRVVAVASTTFLIGVMSKMPLDNAVYARFFESFKLKAK